MSIITTDKVPEDTNSEIMRVLYQTNIPITVSTVAGSFYTGSATVDLPLFKSESIPVVEVYRFPTDVPGLSLYYKLPMRALTVSGTTESLAYFTITKTTSGGNSVLQLTINAASNVNGATFYYYITVYSAIVITDNVFS